MSQSINQVSYGFSQPLVTNSPIPIPAKRAPTVNDLGYVIGQTWIYNGVAYTLVSNSNHTAIWSAGGGIQTATVVLTSSQIKNLHATPITIIPAQGPGTFIEVIAIANKSTYGGNNVFIAAAAQKLGLYYVDGSGTTIMVSFVVNGQIIAAENRYTTGVISNIADLAPALVENVPVVIFNSVATEISGNAANDNTITVVITYEVLTI
jgi:hypothetical protein